MKNAKNSGLACNSERGKPCASPSAQQGSKGSEQVIQLYEKRVKIYPKAVQGLFNNWRWALVFFTQAIFYGLCWLEWNGRQAVLFHLVERKFYLFGLVLWPQDVFYLAVLLIISAYALFLFTAVAGRLFCGYACPQTVYTEIFLWIERLVEGDRQKQIKLDALPNSAPQKLIKKITKHLLWLVLALWTGFTLVGYFTPMSELLESARDLQFGPWEWFWILFYGGFTYLMAGFMREQVCKHMCPYARFQGVMFDPDTLVISYDTARGEPRGARKKGAASDGKGDCIDCGLCVQVCPTGIDIRNGLQYECIGCAACIDACDQVMDKVGLPRGLVRYSTENALDKHYTRHEILRHIVRPRVLLYTGILSLIVMAFFWGLATRVPLKVDIIRDRGNLGREVEDGLIENTYTLQVMNSSERNQIYLIKVAGLSGLRIVGPDEIEVPAASARSVLLQVRGKPDTGNKGSNPMEFTLQSRDQSEVQVREKSTFIIPR